MLKYLLILMIPVMSMNSFVQAVTNNIWGESYAMGGGSGLHDKAVTLMVLD